MTKTFRDKCDIKMKSQRAILAWKVFFSTESFSSCCIGVAEYNLDFRKAGIPGKWEKNEALEVQLGSTQLWMPAIRKSLRNPTLFI